MMTMVRGAIPTDGTGLSNSREADRNFENASAGASVASKSTWRGGPDCADRKFLLPSFL